MTSSRRSSRTCSAPASPRAASPHAIGRAHHDRLRAEGQRFDYVGATSDPTIDENWNRSRDGVDDLPAARRAMLARVKLSAAVVRHGNGRGAMLDRQASVRAGQDTLDHNG